MTSPKITSRTDGSRSPLRPRIAIDLHVADGIFQGSRTHCLELFSRVFALTPEFDFIVLSEDPEKLCSISSSFSLPYVSHVRMPHRPAPMRLLWQIPQLVRHYRIDLLHTQYIVPPVAHCPTAVTVHDILFESHPQFFEKAFVARSRLLVPSSVRRSALLFTVSEFSRRQICQNYSIPQDRVHSIPNGVDFSRFHAGNDGNTIIEGLGLKSGAYFLSVGRLEPRKNHATLLRAWAKLPGPRPRLVIVGQRHFHYDEVFNLISELRLSDEIAILEQVSDPQLPAIYRHAKAFVYCSWAEGFGIPLLEAMASGIPVISSPTTALFEVGGDAVFWAEPTDPNQIASAITAVDQQDGVRRSLIDRGLRRVTEFTWDRPAEIVRKAYLNYFHMEPGAALGPDRPVTEGMKPGPLMKKREGSESS